MSTIDRNWLYSVFENFDKPTEYDFRELIKSAFFPTSFSERVVTPNLGILPDLNSDTFELDIRQVYVIRYGALTYFLFGEEGTWGDGGNTILQENILLFSSSFALLESITSNVNVGGIKAGQTFPAGTTYDNLWKALLVLTQISNLNYTANTSAAYLEVGTTLSISKFLWTVGGTPLNLRLVDSDGTLNVVVTGNQHTIDKTYSKPVFSSVQWTLSGDNVSSITKTTYWVEPSYFGKKLTGTVPTSAEILAGSKLLTLTSTEISAPLNTLSTEYGWIAVEVNQADGDYTNWFITELNRSTIGPAEFIKKAGAVSVNGKTYSVYMFNYPTEVGTLKLS